tara:strand:- start:257 stop:505 length:249 start_codon:yes stop_codon:yes gene_type:complete
MKKISKNKEKINKIVSEILKISIDKIQDNIEMNKISQWDSVAHLLIISSLEEEFKIQFSSSEVSKLVDLKSIYQIIEVNLIK